MATPTTEPCRLIEWDTEFWGFPVARATGDTLDKAALESIDRWAEAHGISCLYFLATADDQATIRLAESSGFRSVDIRVTLGRSIDGPIDLSGIAQLRMRDPEPADRRPLAELARISYRFTRFYNDENFPDERCDDLYEHWILANLAEPAEKLILAEDEGKLVGYISCRLDSDGKAGRLGLTAVSANVRRGGFGRALLLSALDWLQQNGAEHVTVATQAMNSVTQRMLQRGGFRTEKTEIWYHKWYGAVPGSGPLR